MDERWTRSGFDRFSTSSLFWHGHGVGKYARVSGAKKNVDVEWSSLFLAVARLLARSSSSGLTFETDRWLSGEDPAWCEITTAI